MSPMMKKALCAAAAAVCLLAQTGCRYSPALMQIIYNQSAEDVSTDETLIHNNQDNTEKDDTIFSVAVDAQAEQERDVENVIAQYGATEEQSQERTASVVYSETAGDFYSSGLFMNKSEPEDDSDGEEEGDLRNEKGAASLQNDGVTVTQTNRVGSESENVNKQETTASGERVELPDGGTAVAVGQAAILVQMLGGQGALAAASEDFLENEWVQIAFADEGAAEVPVLWSGDGSTALGDDAFAQMLELEPAVCFEISGQMTFTEDQLEQMAEQGIVCVTLPPLTSASGILTAISVIGETLGDRSEDGGQNALALSKEYQAWYDDLLEELGQRVSRFTVNGVDYDNDGSDGVRYITDEGAESGLYTLYISDWDSEVLYRISTVSYVEWEEYGLPIAVKGYTNSPISYYMSLAGVVNKGAAATSGTSTRPWYVHPINSVAHIKSIVNGATGVKFNNTNGSQTAYLTAGLGGADYPALVTASQSIKTALENSEIWQRQSWTDQGDVEVVSTIEGPYEIYVNPDGVGSWSDGSAESVLEAVWIAWRFQGSYTEEEVRDAIREFYSEFYRFDLTDSQITAILAGRE